MNGPLRRSLRYLNVKKFATAVSARHAFPWFGLLRAPSPLAVAYDKRPVICFCLAVLLVSLCAGCGRSVPDVDLGSDDPRRAPEYALENLEVADGLEAALFASEPMIVNPTNLAIDDRGRVWVCEAVNYRPDYNPHHAVQEKGDRIVILEDEDGDGTADSRTVYYQGSDINAALGILVFGNRVLVSSSPNVLVFTDADGDDRPDSKDTLFTGIGGLQDDHGIHAFVFGPDGRLYFNFGNAGRQLMDSAGRPVAGSATSSAPFSGGPYHEGMVFRSAIDGTNVEVLAHNFRNSYEVAIDAFGMMWQSDNDDDGNRASRIVFVMEGGNFGYLDEVTGAHWSRPRTGMHDEIPARHWHQRDPGVVPNVLITGAGSPSGIAVYEGELLPEPFRGQLIHADASPGVVRAYPLTVSGAGYRAGVVDILRSPRDQWFRPSDVAVAPDGSLFVADWYDATVGGNQAVDQQRGRIYRVAPPDSKYEVAAPAYHTPEAAARALANPNMDTQAQAYLSLEERGAGAEEALVELWGRGDSRRRARALWLLGRLRESHLEDALRDPDPDLRATALRVARSQGIAMAPLAAEHAQDTSARVRREAALALRGSLHPEAARAWAELAKRHHGSDRWYLEALGIGAEGQWDRFFPAWLETQDVWDTPAGRDIIWRARTSRALPFLSQLARDTTRSASERDRYFRAFDFHDGPEKHAFLQDVLAGVRVDRAAQLHRALLHLAALPVDTVLLAEALHLNAGSPAYLDLVERFGDGGSAAELHAMALGGATPELAPRAARALLALRGPGPFREALAEGKTDVVVRLLQGIGLPAAQDLLEEIMLSEEYTPDVRRQATRALARSEAGQERLLDLARNGHLPEQLAASAASVLLNVWSVEVRMEAEQLLGLPIDRNARPLPPLRSLVAAAGNAVRGEVAYGTFCNECHGASTFGPSLSGIGSKLTEEALFVAILHPAAGISYGYEGLRLTLRDAAQVTGYEVGAGPDFLVLRTAPGLERTIARTDVLASERLEQSLMPDLTPLMSREDLVDIVTYLHSLR